MISDVWIYYKQPHEGDLPVILTL